MDVQALRSEFPALQRNVYLNTGWQGPPPDRVTNAVQERLQAEADNGPTTRPMYEQSVESRIRAREAAARLLNASVEEVCLTPRTTDGLTTVIGGLKWREGDEVITFDIEHPSVLIPCRLLERNHGVRVRCLPLAPDEDHWSILEKVRSALNERTRLVFFSHVQFASGLRMPIEAIKEMTRPFDNVRMLVDGAQTGGHLDLDMRALDCDFYAIPGQKWLLGPGGTGALFIRRDRIPEVEPNQVGFRSILDMESRPTFAQYRINDESIEKFAAYPPSTALTLGFVQAAELAIELGTAEIEERSIALAQRAKETLAETPGVKLLSTTARAGSSGLVSFAVDGIEPEEIVERLWDEDSMVMRAVHNPDGLRFSFAWFNTETEVDRATSAVGRLANR